MIREKTRTIIWKENEEDFGGMERYMGDGMKDGVACGVYWEIYLGSDAKDRSLEYPENRALKTKIGETRNHIQKLWRDPTLDNSLPVSMILRHKGIISVVSRNSIVGGESDFTSAPMTPRDVRRRYSNGRDLDVVFRKG